MFSQTTRNVFLFLLLVSLILPATAQEPVPVKQYKFTMHKTGYIAGEASVSPSGKWLIASFNDVVKPEKTAVFELVNLSTASLSSTGSLLDRPFNINWSSDSRYMIIEYVSKNPVLYDVAAGMNKSTTLSHSGYTVFKPANTLLNPKQKEPEIFVFADETTYIYSVQGKLLDSIEQDDYTLMSAAWYNQLQGNFSIMSSDGFHTYSPKGKHVSAKIVEGLDTYKSYLPDQDGATMTLYDRNGFTRYNVATGKIIMEGNHEDGLNAICITPDKKNIVCKIPGKLSLINEKKGVTEMNMKDYYSYLFYTGFGTELVCVNPDEVKIYACKNYLPVVAPAPVPPQPAPPVVVKNNPKPAPVAPPVPAKPVWDQPYTVADFITPKTADSFYLYTADRGMKYFIKYKKGEPSILWPNPFYYSQFMGFGSEAKYQSYYTYLLDNTDGEARMGTYAFGSSLGSKQQMVGGPNFLAKIPAKGQTISWKNKLYEDEYTLTAQVVDMVYKGKPKKFLAVSRGGTYNGQPIDEAWYYQLWYGLTFIKSGGKVVYERVF